MWKFLRLKRFNIHCSSSLFSFSFLPTQTIRPFYTVQKAGTLSIFCPKIMMWNTVVTSDVTFRPQSAYSLFVTTPCEVAFLDSLLLSLYCNIVCEIIKRGSYPLHGQELKHSYLTTSFKNLDWACAKSNCEKNRAEAVLLNTIWTPTPMHFLQ